MPDWLSSTFAVLIGYASMAVVLLLLTTATIRFFREREEGHNVPYLIANFIYSVVASAIGGIVCVRIAERTPLHHGFAMAAILCVLSIISAWQLRGRQPLSYQITLIVMSPISVIAGAAL